MTSQIPEQQLSQASDFVAATLGLYFPRARWNALERQAKLAAREFGFAAVEPFLEWLLSSPLNQEQVEMLASYLTISETYFWREPHVFDALRDQILPELIRERRVDGRHLRLWSAGCATGEEPYSIAIALREALPDLKDWHITLLATDINPRILKQAAAAEYGEWSFRNAPAGFKEKYFRPREKGRYEIDPEIRKMVTFAYLNLASDPFPSPMNDTIAMDLIFCRNVLMYFTPTRASLVGQRLYHCLVEGGWFIVSSSELSQHMFSQFISTNFAGAIIYRRGLGNVPPALGFPTALPATAPNQPVQPHAVVKAPAAPVTPATPSHRTARPQGLPVRRSQETLAQAAPQEDVLTAVRILANQGRLAEAWAACELGLAADKLDPGLHYLGATILQELNREGEAVALLKRLLYLEPNFLLAHFALGNLAQRRGNLAAARKSFKNVLVLLQDYQPDDILPEVEGLTAGRLRKILRATLQTGVLTA